MKKIYELLLSHPKEKNLTYFEHFNRSIKLSCKMFAGSVALFIHAFLPFLCEKTGTDIARDVSNN